MKYRKCEPKIYIGFKCRFSVSCILVIDISISPASYLSSKRQPIFENKVLKTEKIEPPGKILKITSEVVPQGKSCLPVQ